MIKRILVVLLVLGFIPGYVNMVKAIDGLDFYLPMDEGSGNPMDMSDNPTDVVIKGQLEWVDGSFGKGLKFNGNAANFVEAAHSEKLDGMQAMTIMAWAKPETPDANARGIVSKRIASQQSDSYSLFSWTDVKFYARTNSKGEIKSQTVLEDGKWYHIVYVFNGNGAADEKVKLYINGKLEASGTHTESNVTAGGAKLFIGTLNEGYAQNWKGVLDDISIWNVALTEVEILGYMSGPITPVQPRSKLSAKWGEIKRKI